MGNNILVIGAGVSGLSTAILLAEAGNRVTIWAAEHPQLTTSGVAAAVWYPYKAYPEELVLPWSARTLGVFDALASDGDSGVLLREGIELWRDKVADPWWAAAVPDLRRARPDELPAGYADGYVFRAPVIEMPIYLAYLLARFEGAAGRLEHRKLESLAPALDAADVIVDCAGLGARELLGDEQLYPIRGQTVRLSNPGLERFVLDEEHPDGVTYIVPRSADCILGGTSEQGEWDTRPSRETAAAILARCFELEPRLEQATILEHRVGLRPGRTAIRLEREALPGGKLLVHNYGHGGAGVTLSWGCAEEAAMLVEG